jgi:hypothetical protein
LALIEYLRNDRHTGSNREFKKAYDSGGNVLYNVLIWCDIPLKLLIKNMFSRIQVGKHLFDVFRIKNGLKERGALLPLLLSFAVECAIRQIHANQEDLTVNGTHQLLVYADDVNICHY